MGDVVAAVVDSWRRFAADHVDAVAIDRGGEVPRAVREGLADLGLFGLSVPEAYGGAGLGLADVAAVVRAVARVDRSVGTTLGLHLGLGTRGLVRFGTAAQHERYLPDLATGVRLGAFAATEPGAGSDLSAITTTARRDGDALVLSGQKLYVTNGGWAGLVTVYAATPGLGGRKRGHGLVLVEAGDGYVVGPEERKLGLRGSSTTALFFDDVRVPADRLLGEAGTGREQLAHVLAWGRVALCAGTLGIADAAIAAATTHCSTRRQFRRPLDAQPVVQDQLAALEAERAGMEAMVRRCADLDGVDLELASLATKVACSEGAWRVVDLALQLHGGMGYIEDGPMPLLLRDARIARIFEGANDVLLARAGAAVAVGGLPPRCDDRASPASVALQERLAGLRAAHGVGVVRMPRALWLLGALWRERELVDAARWAGSHQVQGVERSSARRVASLTA